MTEEEWEKKERERMVLGAIEDRKNLLRSAGVSEKGIGLSTGTSGSTMSKLLTKGSAIAQKALNPIFGAGDFLRAGTIAVPSMFTSGERVPMSEARRIAKLEREEYDLNTDDMGMLERIASQLAPVAGTAAQFAVPATGAGRLTAMGLSKVPGAKKVADLIGSATEGAAQGAVGSLIEGDSSVGKTAGLGAGLSAGLTGTAKLAPYVTGMVAGLKRGVVDKIPEAVKSAPRVGTDAFPTEHYVEELRKGLGKAKNETVLGSRRGSILDEAEASGVRVPLKPIVAKINEDATAIERTTAKGVPGEEISRYRDMIRSQQDMLTRDALIDPTDLASLGVTSLKPMTKNELSSHLSGKGLDSGKADEMATRAIGEFGYIGAHKLNAAKRYLQAPPKDKADTLPEAEIRKRFASAYQKMENQGLDTSFTGVPGMGDYNAATSRAFSAMERMGIPITKKIEDGMVKFEASPSGSANLVRQMAKGKMTEAQMKEVSDSMAILGIDPKIIDQARNAELLSIVGRGNNIHGSRAGKLGSDVADVAGLTGPAKGLTGAALGLLMERFAGPTTRNLAMGKDWAKNNPMLADQIRMGLTRPATSFMSGNDNLTEEQKWEAEEMAKLIAEARKNRGTK